MTSSKPTASQVMERRTASLLHVPTVMLQQSGTGSSRRHIQGSKIAKGLPCVNLQYSKIENQKNGPSGVPGPASASPWLAKRRDTSETVNIFVAVEGGTLWVF